MQEPPRWSDLPNATSEIDARMISRVREGLTWAGSWYALSADSIMGDNRPDYAQRFYAGMRTFQTRLTEQGVDSEWAPQAILQSLGHLPMYILYGWETGIRNEFRFFQSQGFTKAQIMELVMFAQLMAGMRGLGHVYYAVGTLLPDFRDGHGHAPFPAGWAPDPDAFKAGLDFTTHSLTGQDRKNIEAWYESTIGFLPKSVRFGMSYHPEFYKAHRARWEVIFQTLPKQVEPYSTLRLAMIHRDRDALREAALLGKAWGITREWLVHGLAVSAYFVGFAGLSAAYDAIDDLLADGSWK
jgi:hypothetical protein